MIEYQPSEVLKDPLIPCGDDYLQEYGTPRTMLDQEAYRRPPFYRNPRTPGVLVRVCNEADFLSIISDLQQSNPGADAETVLCGVQRVWERHMQSLVDKGLPMADTIPTVAAPNLPGMPSLPRLFGVVEVVEGVQLKIRPSKDVRHLDQATISNSMARVVETLPNYYDEARRQEPNEIALTDLCRPDQYAIRTAGAQCGTVVCLDTEPRFGEVNATHYDPSNQHYRDLQARADRFLEAY